MNPAMIQEFVKFMTPSATSSSEVLPLPAEAVTTEQILAQETIEKNRLIAEAAALEADVLAKAAKMNEDQERRRIEAALRNEPPHQPLPKENKTQVDTPTKQESPLTTLKREIEGQQDQMNDDEPDGDARRVRTKA